MGGDPRGAGTSNSRRRSTRSSGSRPSRSSGRGASRRASSLRFSLSFGDSRPHVALPTALQHRSFSRCDAMNVMPPSELRAILPCDAPDHSSPARLRVSHSTAAGVGMRTAGCDWSLWPYCDHTQSYRGLCGCGAAFLRPRTCSLRHRCFLPAARPDVPTQTIMARCRPQMWPSPGADVRWVH